VEQRLRLTPPMEASENNIQSKWMTQVRPLLDGGDGKFNRTRPRRRWRRSRRQQVRGRRFRGETRVNEAREPAGCNLSAVGPDPDTNESNATRDRKTTIARRPGCNVSASQPHPSQYDNAKSGCNVSARWPHLLKKGERRTGCKVSARGPHLLDHVSARGPHPMEFDCEDDDDEPIPELYARKEKG